MLSACQLHFWTIWNVISWFTSLFDVVFSWLFVDKTIRHEMSQPWFVVFAIITGIAGFFVLLELFSLLKESVKNYQEHFQGDGYLVVAENEDTVVIDTEESKNHVHWPSIIGSLFQDFVLVIALYIVKDESTCELNVTAYEEALAVTKTRHLFEAIFAAVTMVNALLNFVSLLIITLARFRAQRESVSSAIPCSEVRECCALPALVLSLLLFLASVILGLIAFLTNVTGTPDVLPPQFGIQFRSSYSYDAVYYSWAKTLVVGNITGESGQVNLFPTLNISMIQQDTSYGNEISKFVDTTIWKWPNGTFNFTHFGFNQKLPCSSLISPDILHNLESNFGVENITNCTIHIGGWWANAEMGLDLHIRYGYQVSNGTSCSCGNFTGGSTVKEDLAWSNDTWYSSAAKICSMNSCGKECLTSDFSQAHQPQIFCPGNAFGFCHENETKQNLTLLTDPKNVNLNYSTENDCICGCELDVGEPCLVEVVNREKTCKTVRTGKYLLHKQQVCEIQSSCGSKPGSMPDFQHAYPAQNKWKLELKPFVRCGLKEAPPNVIADDTINLPCWC